MKLRPQTFQVLKTLVQNTGKWISCERLIAEAWDGHHVRDIPFVTVGELKNALEEYGAWITCRPKIGYRLESPRSDELIKTGRISGIAARARASKRPSRLSSRLLAKTIPTPALTKASRFPG